MIASHKPVRASAPEDSLKQPSGTAAERRKMGFTDRLGLAVLTGAILLSAVQCWSKPHDTAGRERTKRKPAGSLH